MFSDRPSDVVIRMTPRETAQFFIVAAATDIVRSLNDSLQERGITQRFSFLSKTPESWVPGEEESFQLTATRPACKILGMPLGKSTQELLSFTALNENFRIAGETAPVDTETVRKRFHDALNGALTEQEHDLLRRPAPQESLIKRVFG